MCKPLSSVIPRGADAVDRRVTTSGIANSKIALVFFLRCGNSSVPDHAETPHLRFVWTVATSDAAKSFRHSMKDVFLSHASADKETCVRPFAKELERTGISFWLDEAEIAWGESIALKINEGLRESKYVVVFISPHFVGRCWPEKELFSALYQQISGKSDRILPVVIGDPREVLKPYPLLFGISYRLWSKGISALASEIALHIKLETTKIAGLAEACLRHYFRSVTGRDICEAYACFSKRYGAKTSIETYSAVFEKTRKAELLEFRLINIIDDLAFCHIGVVAAGIDDKPEIWRGSVELIREENRWTILTMKGLKPS